MRFLDFASQFDTEPASLAALSTYQFDADYFERRLLRSPALAKARRILVFMDAGQWRNLLQQEVPARHLNRRYLVVPVRVHKKGVFHPKLNLLISEQGGQVQCGSNNLTRSGCSNNLELLNSFRFSVDTKDNEAIQLAQEVFEFFKRACDDAEGETGRMARDWLDEAKKVTPWLTARLPENRGRKVHLVHTYDGGIWKHLTGLLAKAPPKKFLVISPFYDKNGEMVARVHKLWPKCQIELVAQQETTNLPIPALKKLRGRVSLFELRNSSRRLHAKLIAWESNRATSCLVGSANFTTAAFDARNVEACLFVTDIDDEIQSLFDKELGKRGIAFDDFSPGSEQEPVHADTDTESLELTSVLLTPEGKLRVTYKHRLQSKPSKLYLSIRTPEEQRPRAFLGLPNKEQNTATLKPPESVLADTHSTLLATLIADIGDQRKESLPFWIIQEVRLTYEPNSDGLSSTKGNVEETGDGLTEYLEALGNRDGAAAVIEYLQNLNIRYHDGGARLQQQRKFRIRLRDPFHADTAPEWLLQTKHKKVDLEEAIYDFVDRHDRKRLRRHVSRGNINGMENFLDIFTSLIRLLYVYLKHGVVNRFRFIGYLCNLLGVATNGIETSQDYSDGYLIALDENLDGNSDYLEEVCKELNFLGHLYAALVIVQKIRFTHGEQAIHGDSPKRALETLPHIKSQLQQTIRDVGLTDPSEKDVVKALEEYRMFTPQEVEQFIGELDI